MAEIIDPTTIKKPPEWLIKLIQEQGGRNGQSGKLTPDDWHKDVPDGQRNAELTRIAGSLLSKMPIADAWPMILAWNQEHCKPPVEENEVKIIIESIGRKEAKKPLKKNSPKQQATTQSKNLPIVREPIIKTAKELFSLELPEIRWIVTKILPQGLVILAGKPKVGKSWLILHIALSIALGGVALSSIEVEKGDVLYLALEDTERRLKDRLNKLLSGGLPPDNFYYCTNDWGRLPTAGARVDDFLDKHKSTRLVVVDTLQKIRAPSAKGAGVYEQDYEAISTLKTIADKHNVAMVVVHHQRKATSDDIFDTISGSLGITGSADTILILRKEARARADGILHITGRDVEESELALNFDVNTSLWQLMGGAEEYKRSQQRQEVIELIRKSNRSMTPKEIATALNKKPNTIVKLLGKMVESNELSIDEEGKYRYGERRVIEGEI